MKKPDEFDDQFAKLRDKVLAACEPDNEALGGLWHVILMGAVCSEIARLHITFLIDRGHRDGAREVLEGVEKDCAQIRKQFGWLND